ncbi:MAG: 50S ribosomal protein L25 [Tissierellia bacterium]|nr:50S ribosomal protein L25 [Tissierellia bacterium]MDD4725400.1 50S ribosomal protein L25 [Tissierellia bacterium]
MSNYVMNIEPREDVGSNKVRKLRTENIIPAVIYSRGEETKTVSIDELEFVKIYAKAGQSSIVDLKLNGETMPVVVKDVQKHPTKNKVMHIDFQKISMDEKLKMFIPIVLINRDSIKLQPSTLVQQMDQLEIECLPGVLPKSATVDVADLDFATPIYVKDLNVAQTEGITILIDNEEIVCSLLPPTVETEGDQEGQEGQEATQPEVIGEKTEAE